MLTQTIYLSVAALVSSPTAATPIFQDSFDTDLGWTVSGDAETGHWERGVPVNNDRGDPATASGGSGYAFVTGNDAFDSNSDVDGGSTVMTSPTFNAAAQPLSISFDYWFNFANGASDLEDSLTVEVFVNGSDWQEVARFGVSDETSEWTSFIIDGASFSSLGVDSSNITRLRFTAADPSTPSLVEAGIDEVNIFVPEPTVATLLIAGLFQFLRRGE